VPDDVSPEWVLRSLEAHERRADRVHGETDAKITNLAKDLVPLGLYQRGERDRDREIQRLDEEHTEDMRLLRAELKELRDRPQMTIGRWAVIATAAIALCALLVQAYGTLKGAK
jgi:hypothetical protein